MPPTPPELSLNQFIVQKAALGEKLTIGTGASEQIKWANGAIDRAKKNPAGIRESLKAGTEIGDQSLLLKEKLNAETETIGKGVINPDTGKKSPGRTQEETENIQKAEKGSEFVNTLLEYGQLDPIKDQQRIKALEDRTLLILKARPEGKEFFKKPNGNVMSSTEQANFVKKMLQNGAHELRSITMEQTQTFIQDPNKPSSTTEQNLATLERYEDAKFSRDNAQAQFDLAKKEYTKIQEREKEFQNESTPGTLGNRLKTLSDGEPQRKADIQKYDVTIQQRQQELDHAMTRQQHLTSVAGSRAYDPTTRQTILNQLEILDETALQARQDIIDATNAKTSLVTQQEEFEKLKKEKEDLPKEKVRLGEVQREAQSEKIKTDAVFKARSEEYRMAVRLRGVTESYYADALNHLPDHIINTYLDGKIDEVGKRVEEAIPFMNEKLRQKLLRGLHDRQTIETRGLVPFSQKREELNGVEVKFGWEMFVKGHKKASNGVDMTPAMYVQNLVGGPTEWNALTLEQKNAAFATCAVEIFNRYREVRAKDFGVKVLGEQLIKDSDLRELKKFPWNEAIMKAALQTNPQFRQAMEQKLPGVDLTTPEGEEQAKGVLALNNGLYAAMMTFSLASSLFKQQPQQQEENG